MPPSALMSNLADYINKRKQELTPEPEKRHVTTEKQFYGLWVMQELNLPKDYTGKVIRACDKRFKHQIEGAVAAVKKYVPQASDDGRFKYFCKVVRSIH